ncbi:minor capsid protein [Amycolatopsis palatopharyngis]|uniref:minor capsid protein n=1 Tax=Amycolatopsis palatopharyngis TaxID=187982 RepID=UPI000E26E3B9|nr:minor capsid protein [Amycolatopsis palatopharyngis]
MGFTTNLLTGIAEHLDAAGAGVWRPTGAYLDAEIGIVLGVPSQQPPSLIALAAYNNSDDPSLSDSSVTMQVRTRGPDADPRKADDLADAVFDALQGLRATANGIRVVYSRRISTFPLGIDDNGRHERTDNYDLTVHRPSTHRE